MRNFEYNRKAVNGFIVTCYEQGRDGFYDESMYDYRVDAGSGERVEKTEDTVYYADIDNDGVEEWYEKHN